eukprot:gene23695-biopygen20842
MQIGETLVGGKRNHREAWRVPLPGFCASRGAHKTRAACKVQTVDGGRRTETQRRGAGVPCGAPGRGPCPTCRRPPLRCYSRGRYVTTLPFLTRGPTATDMREGHTPAPPHVPATAHQQPAGLPATRRETRSRLRSPVCKTTPLAIAAATVPRPTEATPHVARPEAPDADAPVAADQCIMPRPGGPTKEPIRSDVLVRVPPPGTWEWLCGSQGRGYSWTQSSGEPHGSSPI